MKDKLQEAAEQWALRHAAVMQKEIAIKAYLAGANSKEEAIQEIVSALQASNMVIKTFQERENKYFGTSTIESNGIIIQKHK